VKVSVTCVHVGIVWVNYTVQLYRIVYYIMYVHCISIGRFYLYTYNILVWVYSILCRYTVFNGYIVFMQVYCI
jgi:hypothetical protein